MLTKSTRLMRGDARTRRNSLCTEERYFPPFIDVAKRTRKKNMTAEFGDFDIVTLPLDDDIFADIGMGDGVGAAADPLDDVLLGRLQEPLEERSSIVLGEQNGSSTLDSFCCIEGSLEASIIRDCMWSHNIFIKKERERGVSLTLSECAESLFRDISDVDVLNDICAPFKDVALLTSDQEDDDKEEDVDVQSTSSSTISASSTSSRSSFSVPAGTSLLKKNRLKEGSAATSPPLPKNHRSLPIEVDHRVTDHCYSVRNEVASTRRVTGEPAHTVSTLLTPNASSDEDDTSESMDMDTTKLGLDADQSVKFKFKFKVQPESPRRQSLLKSSGKPHARDGRSHSTRSDDGQRNAPLAHQKSTGSRCNAAGPWKGAKDSRDFHNSMERWRRSDLRKSLEHLKSIVPELRGADKVSKISILNKAAEYCRTLSLQDEKLCSEILRQKRKKAHLQKRLQEVMEAFPKRSGSKRSSSRSNRRRFS